MKKRSGTKLYAVNDVSEQDILVIAQLLERAGFTHPTRFMGVKVSVTFSEDISSLTPSEIDEVGILTVAGVSLPNETQTGATIFTREGHEISFSVNGEGQVEFYFTHSSDVGMNDTKPSCCVIKLSDGEDGP